MFIVISIRCNDKSLNEMCLPTYTQKIYRFLSVFSEHYDLSFKPY